MGLLILQPDNLGPYTLIYIILHTRYYTFKQKISGYTLSVFTINGRITFYDSPTIFNICYKIITFLRS